MRVQIAALVSLCGKHTATLLFKHPAHLSRSCCVPVCCLQVAIVGKGLTFDSGGYNLKAGPGSMIELMKVRG